ncbi:MAG: hypothetical protein ACHQVK_04830, partial [Candidatus Paceibacterales bacterium]
YDRQFCEDIGDISDWHFSDGRHYQERVWCRRVKRMSWFSRAHIYFPGLQDAFSGEWVTESLWTEQEMNGFMNQFKLNLIP